MMAFASVSGAVMPVAVRITRDSKTSPAPAAETQDKEAA